MTEQVASSQGRLIEKNALRTIILTGLLAGTLDGIAASLNFIIATGNNPIKVFIFIASGVFGRDAFSGGNIMAVWGVVFHYVIATGWTTVFFFLYPRLQILSKNKVLTGAAYGFFVWVMMTRIVLPLSNVPPLPFDLGRAILAILILMACVGLPISFMVGKHYAREATGE